MAHFPPENIIIKGEASFADIILDLPRFETEDYKDLVEKVKNINIKSDKPKIVDVDASQLRVRLINQV
jgi:hypothetical protein